MTKQDIAKELCKNEKKKRQCDRAIVQMLKDICLGNVTDENWFLNEALKFIEQDRFDVSGYSLNWYATNQESDPDAPVYLWVLFFIKDEDEFILEVSKNQENSVFAKKWVRTKTGRLSTRKISHIKTAVKSI